MTALASITPEVIQGWFRDAAPSWPVPSTFDLMPLAGFLNAAVFTDPETQARAMDETAILRGDERALAEAARLLLADAIDTLAAREAMAGDPAMHARSLAAKTRASAAIPFLEDLSRTAEASILETIAGHKSEPSKPRPDWHSIAYQAWVLAWQAWDEAGHLGPIGRGEGSAGFKVVAAALEAVKLKVGLGGSNIRQALAGWPDPFPIEGGLGWQHMLAGEFDILDGKRIYATDAARMVARGELEPVRFAHNIDPAKSIILLHNGLSKSEKIQDIPAGKKRGRPRKN